MSKLYGFKYTENSFFETNKTYMILSESNGRYYIDKYCEGTKHHFDITDKIEQFYNEIKDLGIDKWNMNTYDSAIQYTPPSDSWTFTIHFDDISVACSGCGAVPPNWNQFWKAFHRMCSNSKEKS